MCLVAGLGGEIKHGNVFKIIDRPSNHRPRFVKKNYEKCGRGLDASSSLSEYEGKEKFHGLYLVTLIAQYRF